MKPVFLIFALLLLSLAPTLSAKGDMVLIEVKAKSLSAPITITNAKIQEFSIWAGPGVNGAGLQEAEGLIADWSKGAVAAPADVLDLMNFPSTQDV